MLQLLLEFNLLITVGRMKLLQVGAWWDNRHSLRIIIIIKAVLFLYFIMCAGYDKVGISQDLLFGIDTPGNIVGMFNFLTCQTTRSQHRNREEVVARLAALLTQALRVPKKRRATRPTRSSVERRIQQKKRRSALKRQRRQGYDDGS